MVNLKPVDRVSCAPYSMLCLLQQLWQNFALSRRDPLLVPWRQQILLSACIWTSEVCCALQSMLDKTHSVLQSLIEADSAEGERSSGNHDALPDKHGPSLSRCQVVLMIVFSWH